MGHRILFLSILAVILLGNAQLAESQWTQVGPGGLTITALAASENGMMYAGGYGASNVGFGIYRSSDDGEHWSPCNSGLPLLSGGVLGTPYQIVANHETVFVCYMGPNSLTKLYRSLNSGDSWAAFGTGLTNIDLLYQTPGAWFAVYNSFIFRSTNFGVNWAPCDTIPNGNRPGKIVYNHGVVFNDVYQSTDFGVTWTARPGSNDLTFGTSIMVWNGDTLYASGYPSLSRSTNNGLSWTGLSGPFQISQLHRAGDMLFGYNISNTATIYSSHFPHDTWTEVVNDLPGDRDLGMKGFLYRNGSIYMSVGRKGIYRSDDMGAHWRTANKGIHQDLFNSPCIATDGKIVLIGGAGDILFRSTDEGATWLQSSRGMAGAAVSVALRDSIALAGTPAGVPFYRSTDGGQTWTGIFGQITGTPKGILFIGSGTDSVIVAGESKMYRSSDKGVHFTALTTSFVDPPSGHLLEVGTDLYAGTTNNTGGGQLYKSTDRGTSWNRVAADSIANTITGLTSLGSSIVVSSGFAWTPGVIRRSDDGGATWYRIMGSLNPTGYTTGATNVFGNLLTEGTNSIGGRKMYISTNGGAGWTEINEGLSSTYSRAVGIVATDNHVLLLLDGGGSPGVFSRAKVDFVTAVESNGPEVARGFTLNQNYPNPFNPSTKISFELTASSVVSLVVYDNLGREVATLLNNANVQPGNHEVAFDAGFLASGVYYYRLATQPASRIGGAVSGFTSTGKMLLIR